MNIYQIQFESEEFKSLLVDRGAYKTEEQFAAAAAALNFTGSSKTDGWKPPKVHAAHPKRKEGDFWMLGVNSGAFGVREEALDRVYDLLEMAGELLPLPFEDQTLSICNITECIECIDSKRSEWIKPAGPGKQAILRKPFFVPEHLTDSTLFKIPEAPTAIFCWEEHRDPETEFKACVEKFDLTGLKFELVWSEESEDEDVDKEEDEESGED